jgi:hypothetical protein
VRRHRLGLCVRLLFSARYCFWQLRISGQLCFALWAENAMTLWPFTYTAMPPGLRKYLHVQPNLKYGAAPRFPKSPDLGILCSYAFRLIGSVAALVSFVPSLAFAYTAAVPRLRKHLHVQPNLKYGAAPRFPKSPDLGILCSYAFRLIGSVAALVSFVPSLAFA